MATVSWLLMVLVFLLVAVVALVAIAAVVGLVIFLVTRNKKKNEIPQEENPVIDAE